MTNVMQYDKINRKKKQFDYCRGKYEHVFQKKYVFSSISNYVFSFTIYNLFYFSFFQFAFFHLEQLQRLTLSRVVLQWQQITIHSRLSYCMRSHSLFISFLDIYFSFTALHISLLYGIYLSWILFSLLHVNLISLFIWKYLSWIFISLLLSAIFPFSYGKYISWISIYLLHVHYISLFIWKIFSLFLDIYFPFFTVSSPIFPFSYMENIEFISLFTVHHISLLHEKYFPLLFSMSTIFSFHMENISLFLDIYFPFYCPPYFIATPQVTRCCASLPDVFVN